jgi:hypothetical protein
MNAAHLTARLEYDVDRLKASVKSKAEALRHYADQLDAHLTADNVPQCLAVSVGTIAGELSADLASLAQVRDLIARLDG